MTWQEEFWSIFDDVSYKYNRKKMGPQPSVLEFFERKIEEEKTAVLLKLLEKAEKNGCGYHVPIHLIKDELSQNS